MCGIVGYTGAKNAVKVIISGLHRLEYRGYDSAGLAVYSPGLKRLMVLKTPGKISDLENRLESEMHLPPGEICTLGIGHTRWATHGPPTQANAHPHLSRNGEIAVVHNGIIENYAALKARLIQAGYHFTSETDTEVVAHLIEE